jgi:hypothetical protein
MPTGQTEPRVLAEFSTYPEMLAAFRARANERKIARSSEDTAFVAGLTSGYLAKLLAPKPVRRIGMESLGPVLGVLGVKLVMVEDEQAIARLDARKDVRLKERNHNLVHDGVIQAIHEKNCEPWRQGANGKTPYQPAAGIAPKDGYFGPLE